MIKTGLCIQQYLMVACGTLYFYLHKSIDHCVVVPAPSLSIKQAEGSIPMVFWGREGQGAASSCFSQAG